jgi:hypothetical protein
MEWEVVSKQRIGKDLEAAVPRQMGMLIRNFHEETVTGTALHFFFNFTQENHGKSQE